MLERPRDGVTKLPAGRCQRPVDELGLTSVAKGRDDEATSYVDRRRRAEILTDDV